MFEGMDFTGERDSQGREIWKQTKDGITDMFAVNDDGSIEAIA